jgi:hypothetical protein
VEDIGSKHLMEDTTKVTLGTFAQEALEVNATSTQDLEILDESCSLQAEIGIYENDIIMDP